MSQSFTQSMPVPVPVSKGGTGVVTSTGTGSVVLSTAPEFDTSIGFADTTKGILGTTTNNDADAGYVGEYLTQSIPFSSPVSLTSSVARDITKFTLLPAGDWNVWGETLISGTASAAAAAQIGISLVSATFESEPSDGFAYVSDRGTASFAASGAARQTSGIARISLASAADVFLVASCVFSGGTANASGAIKARRAR